MESCIHRLSIHPWKRATVKLWNCEKFLCQVLMIHLENVSNICLRLYASSMPLNLRRTNFHGNIWILVPFTAIVVGKNRGKRILHKNDRNQVLPKLITHYWTIEWQIRVTHSFPCMRVSRQNERRDVNLQNFLSLISWQSKSPPRGVPFLQFPWADI